MKKNIYILELVSLTYVGIYAARKILSITFLNVSIVSQSIWKIAKEFECFPVLKVLCTIHILIRFKTENNLHSAGRLGTTVEDDFVNVISTYRHIHLQVRYTF